MSCEFHFGEKNVATQQYVNRQHRVFVLVLLLKDSFMVMTFRNDSPAFSLTSVRVWFVLNVGPKNFGALR